MEQFQQASFLHLQACVHVFLHHIHSPTPFPHHLPSSTGANNPPLWAGPVLTCSLILQKRKKKDKKINMTFLLV
jgi:hypothetical protein